jgi:hypothetical protein
MRRRAECPGTKPFPRGSRVDALASRCGCTHMRRGSTMTRRGGSRRRSGDHLSPVIGRSSGLGERAGHRLYRRCLWGPAQGSRSNAAQSQTRDARPRATRGHPGIEMHGLQAARPLLRPVYPAILLSRSRSGRTHPVSVTISTSPWLRARATTAPDRVGGADPGWSRATMLNPSSSTATDSGSGPGSGMCASSLGVVRLHALVLRSLRSSMTSVRR